MHCDMIEGQQMSKEQDDMAEREENAVELEAWLEWEMQKNKVELCKVEFCICGQVGEFWGRNILRCDSCSYTIML